jgi:hypothetical protein
VPERNASPRDSGALPCLARVHCRIHSSDIIA